MTNKSSELNMKPYDVYVNGMFKCELTGHHRDDIIESISIFCNMDSVVDITLTTGRRVQVRTNENLLEF